MSWVVLDWIVNCYRGRPLRIRPSSTGLVPDMARIEGEHATWGRRNQDLVLVAVVIDNISFYCFKVVS